MKIQDLFERYINAIGFDDNALSIKEKYKDDVWSMLQKSYAPIGGIRGSGFESADDMVKKIPMWKIATKNSVVRAVVLYKDKNGRKSVAVGTDGSPEGLSLLNDIFKNDIKRSYGEKSKAALGTIMKLIPWQVLEPYIVTPDQVAEMNPNNRIISVTDVPNDDLPTDAKITLRKYPKLENYGYLRDIGGNLVFKVMIGTPHKSLNVG